MRWTNDTKAGAFWLDATHIEKIEHFLKTALTFAISSMDKVRGRNTVRRLLAEVRWIAHYRDALQDLPHVEDSTLHKCSEWMSYCSLITNKNMSQHGLSGVGGGHPWINIPNPGLDCARNALR